MRTPPCRLAGQNKSKRLREDGDGDWEDRFERDNRIPKFKETISRGGSVETNPERNIRSSIVLGKDKPICPAGHFQNLKTLEPKTNKLSIGRPGEGELDGLTILEK